MLNLKHVLFLENALYGELRTSHSIHEGPRAYFVATLLRFVFRSKCHLGNTKMVRYLAPCKLYVVLGTYQEDVFEFNAEDATHTCWYDACSKIHKYMRF